MINTIQRSKVEVVARIDPVKKHYSSISLLSFDKS